VAFGFGVAVLGWSGGSGEEAAAEPPAPVEVSAGNGAKLFERMCTGCHDLDSEKEGPRLRGVFGRRAGAVAGFRYSDGLKAAHVVWDEASLDRWLTDPAGVVPDNDMAFRLTNAGQRADIIAYLKSLAEK
jgi:cytochrome c